MTGVALFIPVRITTIDTKVPTILNSLFPDCVTAPDIKPQNILLETPAIDEMFQRAPSEAFTPQLPPLAPPNDFYRPSEQLSSAEQDLATATDISVRLADFGTGEMLCSLSLVFVIFTWPLIRDEQMQQAGQTST